MWHKCNIHAYEICEINWVLRVFFYNFDKTINAFRLAKNMNMSCGLRVSKLVNHCNLWFKLMTKDKPLFCNGLTQLDEYDQFNFAT